MRPSPASLRTTFTTLFAAVAVAVTLTIGFLSYDAAARLVRVDEKSVFNEVVHDLQSQVRQERLTAADYATSDPDHDGPRDDLIRPTRTDVQVLGPGGSVADHGNPRLPVVASDRRIAAARKPATTTHTERELDGDEYRIATVALGGGRGAVQVAQQFSDTEDLLTQLQRRTAVLALAVVVAAGLAGWWLARRITGRLVRLTAAAEEVAETGDLRIAVPVAGRDEVARLGLAFDRMLGRLARSVEDQRRLVQDAGHELRTPLTSLRTNISVLARIDRLPPAARAELTADLAGEVRELTDLVNELIELAAGQLNDEPYVEVSLAEIAEDVAARARRRTGRAVTVEADDTLVTGRPAALQRAVANLVDNATKFDADGDEPIVIEVTGHRVAVYDRGPGLTEEECARVFDRFYRAPTARSLPGSGLGLSIVREVAGAHGGTVFAQRRAGGGAVIGFTVR
ncbi:two-component sensor histidine kinase [Streptomyces sp. Ru73]|uniref:sensor histidine kinase n=1 Tax=Streptomyces sp. Ru73 TaxID=2080748 RepID=UPI000CDD6636|nr:HAMP domain-containing sensor histidine kinase [Streptomyces sp. Ru73]POX37097.1 two-component sensor histidine kinase [Streptomyces sp. Ru73]